MIRNLFHVRLFDNQSTRGDRGGRWRVRSEV
jgi:hypothetical protein